MQDFRSFLLDKYNQYSKEDVSAADFVQAAGNIGVISCRGGVKVKTVSRLASKWDNWMIVHRVANDMYR